MAEGVMAPGTVFRPAPGWSMGVFDKALSMGSPGSQSLILNP